MVHVEFIIQQIILGMIQGITEWLPVSSSGMTTLVMTNFFGITDITLLLHQALFLHLGTFLAALIYFRKDVAHILKDLFNYKHADSETQKLIKFLIISTTITGILGIIILKTITEAQFELTGKAITFAVGVLLLITGSLQLGIKTRGLRKIINLEPSDSILAGLAQGIAVLPGISRSGITVSTLLLKKLDDTAALKLSFLMSLPIVLLGNIFLNLPDFTTTIALTSIFGLITSFIFGLLTIHALMKLSKKINFGWFVLVFAILMMLSVLV